jgi:hypothetical protein
MHYFNADASTLVGVSLPSTIPFALKAIARMMAVTGGLNPVGRSSA